MKWLRRLTWTLLAFLLLAAVGFWIRGKFIVDVLAVFPGNGTSHAIYSCDGSLIYRLTHQAAFAFPEITRQHFHLDSLDFLNQQFLPSHDDTATNFFLFTIGHGSDLVPVENAPGYIGSADFGAATTLEIPFSIIITLLALPFLVALIRWLKRKTRIKNYSCVTCSYDLRAHLPGGKCPECGTLIPFAAIRESPLDSTAN